MYGPQARKLIKDQIFPTHITEVEKAAWHSFIAEKQLCGFCRNDAYKLSSSWISMSLKVHYIFSHLHCFPENLGNMSEEQMKGIKLMQESILDNTNLVTSNC